MESTDTHHNLYAERVLIKIIKGAKGTGRDNASTASVHTGAVEALSLPFVICMAIH